MPDQRESRRPDQLDALCQLIEAFSRTTRLDEFLDQALGGLQAATRLTRSAILLREEAGRLRLGAASGFSAPELAAIERAAAGEHAPSPSGDAGSDAAGVDLPATLAWFPLRQQAGDVGVLVVDCEEASGPGREASMIGRIVAALAAAAVERHRVDEECQRLAAREQLARKIAADRDRLYQEATEASRAKDEFLATLSHELRTPLNAIVGWIHMIKHGMLSPDAVKRAIDSVERNATVQSQLIADLLDVSRIITGKMALDCGPVDLSSTIDAALDAVRSAAAAKGIHITVTTERDACPIWGDGARLQQIVWNLLSNAVKFTPQGGRVEVTLRRVGTQVELRVADTGIGISPQFLPYVFDRFKQADQSATRAHGGLGLGLAIVRHLAELHGGVAIAESPGPGQGATFIIRLPVPAVLAQAEAAEPSHPVDAVDIKLHGLRVLVVDDDEDARHLVDAVLEHRGAEVHTADSVDAAFELFCRHRPDVLLIDLAMPVEDGYTLIKRIRALPPDEGGSTPAAALTAYAGAADHRLSLAAGFQMHLAKPIEPQRLVSLVAALAGRAGTNV